MLECPLQSQPAEIAGMTCVKCHDCHFRQLKRLVSSEEAGVHDALSIAGGLKTHELSNVRTWYLGSFHLDSANFTLFSVSSPDTGLCIDRDRGSSGAKHLL